jgi:hypothetical protein
LIVERDCFVVDVPEESKVSEGRVKVLAFVGVPRDSEWGNDGESFGAIVRVGEGWGRGVGEAEYV